MSRDDILRDAAAAAFAFPESVGELLEETHFFVRRFVVVTDVQADVIALWNAHSYVFYLARATPYLHVWSPDTGRVTHPSYIGQFAGPYLFASGAKRGGYARQARRASLKPGRRPSTRSARRLPRGAEAG